MSNKSLAMYYSKPYNMAFQIYLVFFLAIFYVFLVSNLPMTLEKTQKYSKFGL